MTTPDSPTPIPYPVPPKPGYKTTEFYAVLAGLIVTVLVVLEVLEPGQETEHLQDVLVNALTAAAALASNAAIIARYIHARTALKLPAAPVGGATAAGERVSMRE